MLDREYHSGFEYDPMPVISMRPAPAGAKVPANTFDAMTITFFGSNASTVLSVQ